MKIVYGSCFAILLTMFGLFSAAASATEQGNSDEMSSEELGQLLENPGDPKAPNYCADSRQYLEKKTQATLRNQFSISPAYVASKESPDRASCFQSFAGNYTDQTNPGKVPHFLSQQLDKVLSVSKTDLACVAAAQKTFGQSGYGFADCTGNSEKKYANRGSGGAHVPCRSISNVMTVARSIETVAACTGANSRDLFKLFSKESGLMLNSLSWTGVAGIGQTSGIAIRQVQQVDQRISMSTNAKRVAAQIEENIYGSPGNPPKNYCRQLRGLETNFNAAEANKDCSILGFPQVALLPTLLGAKYYLYMRADIEGFANKLGLQQDFGAGYQDLVRAATYYCYSAAGPLAGRSAFQAVALAAKGKNWSREKIFTLLRERVLARTPVKRRGEVEDYFQSSSKAKDKVGTEDFYEKVKAKVGGRECF